MNGNGSGPLPEPSTLDFESQGYLNGDLSFHYSNPANEELKTRFLAFLDDVQSHKWGTAAVVRDKQGRKMYSYLGLEKLLMILRPILSDHGLTYTCHQGVLPTGQITSVHVFLDNRVQDDGQLSYDYVRTAPQVGPVPPVSKDPQDWGKCCTYANRRTLLMCLGIWPDEDLDGLTRAELRALKAEVVDMTEDSGDSGKSKGRSRTKANTKSKGNGSKAKQTKVSNGAQAPKGQANGSKAGSKSKVKLIGDLIADDDGTAPGRADFLRALEAGGIKDATQVVETTEELCKQHQFAYPPSGDDPESFPRLTAAYTGAVGE